MEAATKMLIYQHLYETYSNFPFTESYISRISLSIVVNLLPKLSF